jgi:polysaccharide transporter, PST family
LSLSVKAARGGIIMFSGQALKISLQIINLIILARLLLPEDFGLVAMVLAIFGICDILLDFGLSTASIQAAQITKKQISNLFWVNVLIGIVLAVIAFLSSEKLASFYGRPELITIAQVMSLSFIFNGISAQYKAQLNRELYFKKMVTAEVLAISCSIAIGIYCAHQGLGYWAVVAQLLAQSLIQMLMYVIFGRWIPSLPDRSEDIRGFLNFGWGLVGSQLLVFLSNNVPSMLIGRQIGANQLGLFDRANRLLMLPLNQLNAPLSAVALPILSKLEAEDKEKYNRFLLFGQNIIVHIVVFSLALATCQTEQLVTLVLGAQWREMVPVFIGLSFAGIFLVLSYTSYWVFLTKGITASLFRMGIIGRPIVILITCLGLFGDVIGVAYAYSLGLMFQWLLGLYWLRNTGIPIRAMISGPITVAFCYFSSAHISNYLVSSTVGAGSYNLFVGWAYMLIVLIIFYLLIPNFRKSVLLLFEIKKYIRHRS